MLKIIHGQNSNKTKLFEIIEMIINGIACFIQKELSTNKCHEKSYPEELTKTIVIQTHLTYPT